MSDSDYFPNPEHDYGIEMNAAGALFCYVSYILILNEYLMNAQRSLFMILKAFDGSGLLRVHRYISD